MPKLEKLRNSVVFIMLLIALIAALSSISASNNVAQRQLSTAMRLAAQYHGVGAAYDNGYIQAGDCIPGQGYYLINYNYLSDNAINVKQPEILLYTKTNAGLQFVGFQYVLKATSTGDKPYYFGENFSGPVSGDIPNAGQYYYLNVWMTRIGQGGRFANYNDQITCP